jgi:hypothetical protein
MARRLLSGILRCPRQHRELIDAVDSCWLPKGRVAIIGTNGGIDAIDGPQVLDPTWRLHTIVDTRTVVVTVPRVEYIGMRDCVPRAVGFRMHVHVTHPHTVARIDCHIRATVSTATRMTQNHLMGLRTRNVTKRNREIKELIEIVGTTATLEWGAEITNFEIIPVAEFAMSGDWCSTCCADVQMAAI